MKNKILLIILIVLTFANKNFSQENSATLDETVSWIEGKLNYLSRNSIGASEIKVKYDKTTKTLKYTTLYMNSDLTPKQYSIYYLPVKSINPNNIQITEKDGTYWLYLYSNNDKDSFKWESWFIKDGPEKKLTYMEANIFFVIPPEIIAKETNLPERLKKAFIHLIKLSGGTGEKF